MTGASRLVHLRTEGAIPNWLQTGLSHRLLRLDRTGRHFSFEVPGVDYLRLIIDQWLSDGTLDFYLTTFGRILHHSDGQPFICLEPGADYRRIGSEAVGAAVALCLVDKAFQLNWSTAAHIPAQRTRKAPRADFLCQTTVGDLVVEAKGTTQPNAVRPLITKATNQKMSSIGARVAANGFAVVTRVPIVGDTNLPSATIVDPEPIQPQFIADSIAGIGRCMLVLERISSFAGLVDVAEVGWDGFLSTLGGSRGRRRSYRATPDFDQLISSSVSTSRIELERVGLVLGYSRKVPGVGTVFTGVAESQLRSVWSAESVVQINALARRRIERLDMRYHIFPDGEVLGLESSIDELLGGGSP